MYDATGIPKQMNLSVPMKLQVSNEVLALLFKEILFQGDQPNMRNSVELIKLFRSEMQGRNPGLTIGLKEAKDFCDEIKRRLTNWAKVTV